MTARRKPEQPRKRQSSQTHSLVSLSPEAIRYVHDEWFVRVRDDIDRLDATIMGTRGPARKFPLRILVLGLAAMISEQQAPQILNLCRVLRWVRKHFPDDYRTLFGTSSVPRPHNLYYQLRLIKQWAGDPGRERDEKLDALADVLVKASVEHQVADGWPDEWSVDGTLFNAYSRSPGTAAGKAGLGSDPDARVRKYDRGDGKPPKLYFGYLAFAATTKVGGREKLVKVMLRSADASEVPMADAVVGMMTDRCVGGGRLIQDRGMSQDTKHLARTRDAGIGTHFDLRKDQIGFRGLFRGCLIIDGGLYAPCMPRRLWDSPVYDGSGPDEEKKEKRKAWFAFHAERDHYRFVPNGRKGRTQSMRFQSPAVRGRLRCPHVPESMAHPDPSLPMCDGDHGPDEGCAARNVTFGQDNTPLFQYPFWGTPEWHNIYGRRSQSERAFNLFKNRWRVGQINYGVCLRGQAKVSLVMFICAAMVNLALDYGDYAEEVEGPLFADTG